MSASKRSSPLAAALVAACTALPACDRLHPEPGGDFGVRALDPHLQAIGKITVPLRFEVSGCADFDAAVRGGGGATYAIEPVRQRDGSYRADVPVVWLGKEDRTCVDDAAHLRRSTVALLVTCRDAGRPASAEFTLAYGTATRARDTGGSAVADLAAGTDPLVPVAASPGSGLSFDPRSGVVGVDLAYRPIAWHPGLVAERPRRLTASADRIGLALGCTPTPTEATCPTAPVDASTEVAGGRVLLLRRDSFGSHEGVVPGDVVDLHYADDGALLTLSVVVASHRDLYDGTVVSRVTPGESTWSGEARTEVIAYFPGELAQTGFSTAPDGKLAFASLLFPSLLVPPSGGPDATARSLLHVTDGRTVETRPDPAGDLDVGQGGRIISAAALDLSPDSSMMVVARRYAGAPGSEFATLPVTSKFDLAGPGAKEGVAWTNGVVGIWGLCQCNGEPFPVGRVEAFDRAPPHRLAFTYDVAPLAGADAKAGLLGVIGVGDKLVLTTTTGVRILGPDGTVVGGADPLPCRLAPSAVATQVGPTTVAVGAGAYVYVFDLSQP